MKCSNCNSGEAEWQGKCTSCYTRWQGLVQGALGERRKIVAWLRTFPLNKHALEWASAIENNEDFKPGPSTECIAAGCFGCYNCE